jgi:hypothetical protein
LTANGSTATERPTSVSGSVQVIVAAAAVGSPATATDWVRIVSRRTRSTTVTPRVRIPVGSVAATRTVSRSSTRRESPPVTTGEVLTAESGCTA